MAIAVIGLLVTGWLLQHVVQYFQIALDYHYILAYALVLVRRYADAWKHAHAAEEAGITLSPQFLQRLSQAMPDPEL